MSGNFRILEREYIDGNVVYILERQNKETSTWESVYRHSDLEVIRQAKAKREEKAITNERVID